MSCGLCRAERKRSCRGLCPRTVVKPGAACSSSITALIPDLKPRVELEQIYLQTCLSVSAESRQSQGGRPVQGLQMSCGHLMGHIFWTLWSKK